MCCYIKFTVVMILYTLSRLAALSYFPFDRLLVNIIYPDNSFCSSLKILPFQHNCLPHSQPICLPTLPHVIQSRPSYWGWTPPRPPDIFTPASTLPSFAPTTSSWPPNFTNLSFCVPPLVQTALLRGSQSNNTASEATAIIKSNALADLTSLTPLIS